MDLLKKAKAKMGEVEHDLANATQALGLNKHAEAAPSEHASVAPSSITSVSAAGVNTPTSSTDPSVINTGAPSVKLPLAVRKSIRDDWDSKRPELEATISEKLGVPWTCPIDYGTLWPYADEGYAKQNPGRMIAEYVESFLYQLNYFIDKHGQGGIDELNIVANKHALIIAHVDGPSSLPRNGCDIVDGVFRIFFKDGNLDTNIHSACENISGAINKAGLAQANAAPGGATSALDFEARSDIARSWDSKAPALQAEFQSLLNTPVFTLSPNFEQNAAKLLAWEQAHASGKNKSSNGELREDWRARMGEMSYWYFEGARSRLEEKNFGNDDMLQEGFKDVVDNNEIALRVVDKLTKGTRNEVVFENGVAIIQTIPEHWTVNVSDPFAEIINLL